MTTHELAATLLKEPNVPLHIEGWTSDNIAIVTPQWADDGQARMLCNGDFRELPDIPWAQSTGETRTVPIYRPINSPP